jgi:hypothetical protein
MAVAGILILDMRPVRSERLRIVTSFVGSVAGAGAGVGDGAGAGDGAGLGAAGAGCAQAEMSRDNRTIVTVAILTFTPPPYELRYTYLKVIILPMISPPRLA